MYTRIIASFIEWYYIIKENKRFFDMAKWDLFGRGASIDIPFEDYKSVYSGTYHDVEQLDTNSKRSIDYVFKNLINRDINDLIMFIQVMDEWERDMKKHPKYPIIDMNNFITDDTTRSMVKYFCEGKNV